MANYKQILTTDNAEQGSTSTTVVGGLTIPKQLYGSLIDAVRKNLVWRPLAAMSFGPSDIPGSSVDVVKEDETNPGVDMVEVAEGAEAPMMGISLTTQNVKPVKYMTQLTITEEMLEDGKWNLLQRAVEQAGYKAAKKQDKLIIDVVDAAAPSGNTVSGGSTLTVPNILSGILALENNSYKATDMIIGPEVASDIRNIDIFTQADKSGVTNPTEALIGRIYGMNIWVSDVQNTKYAYIIDRRNAFLYAEKRTVTVKNFDEVWKDVSKAVVSMRFKAAALRANAIAKITTS